MSSERHPKHKALYWDPFTSKWQLKTTKGRAPADCPVAWCRNPKACYYRGTKLVIEAYCYKCKSRRYRANNQVRYAFEAIKDSARKRRIAFTLKFDEFREWCAQTGYASQKGIARLTDHCDRIDDSEGYHIGNIQLLSQSENVRKQRERERQAKEQEQEQDPF